MPLPRTGGRTMPIVETQFGKVNRSQRDGVQTFGGIAFAARPVGEKRGCVPEAPAPWPGVRETTLHGIEAGRSVGRL
jgi:para-nitrobenzyl esterase